MGKYDYTGCLRHTIEYAAKQYPDQVNAIISEFPFNKVAEKHGLNTFQLRITLNGVESEREIKRLLTQKNRYSMLLNKDNLTIYRDRRDIVIEFPSDVSNSVLIGDVYGEEFRNAAGLPLLVGMDGMLNKVIYDLSKAPHMLVAGTTGSGKSIFMHSIIDSIIMNDPTTNIIMIDPKMTEYNVYDPLKHFLLVKEVNEAIEYLEFLSDTEMDARYKILDEAGVRDIDEAMAQGIDMQRMVVMVDEFADLILTSHRKTEQYVVRLAQKARACGIHLVLATQRPSSDVITGLIKSNIPTRACMKVNSAIDSRIVLDKSGGETITAKGEMLLLRNGDFDPIRVQGCFMTADERENIVGWTIKQDNNLLDDDYR